MSKSSKSTVKYYQQGDVLLFKEEEIPEGTKKVTLNDERGIVLAEGEVTGHYHAITNINTCDAWKGENGTLWLDVKKMVPIKHQEHKVINLPKGKYRVGIVKEVDPFSEELKNVAD